MLQHDYSDEDMHAILKRAAAIDGNAMISRQVLERSANELGISPEALEQAEREYRAKKATEDERQEFIKERSASFGQHLASYVIVNLFLIFVWWFTSRGYPWFIWPIMGWGIGIASHAISLRANRGEQFEREFQEWRSRKGAA